MNKTERAAGALAEEIADMVRLAGSQSWHPRPESDKQVLTRLLLDFAATVAAEKEGEGASA